MSLKFSVFIALTVDGFIARSDGSLDWLTGANESISENASEDYGMRDFMSTVDIVLMGRKTYDIVRQYEGPWPYSDAKIYVLSRTLNSTDLPEAHRDRVVVLTGEPNEVRDRLEHEGYSHIYVDGGSTIQQYLRAGHVDEMILTRVPILIGSGISLFAELDDDIQLKPQNSHMYANGFLQTTYAVAARA